jgi:hypothetical protein
MRCEVTLERWHMRVFAAKAFSGHTERAFGVEHLHSQRERES